MTLPEPSRLARDVREAAALPTLADERDRLERLLQDYERGHTAQDAPLVVALVGATGAGKSTLLNALAGEAVAKEGVDRPTTRGAVVYAPEGAGVEALERKAAKVARYRVRAGAPWAGQVFIDTPDVNSVEVENRERARALLDEADVAMVVLHKGSIAEAAQAEFLQEFARRRRLLWVLNFADQLAPSSREELKGQIRALAQSRYGLPPDEAQVFSISALSAKAGEDPSGELPALLYALGRFAQKATAEKVRQSNAAAVLRELKSTVAPALAKAEEGLATVRRELERGLEPAKAALSDDFSRRLQLAGGHLANEVRRQAASRGWGPAAWWMRLSLTGSGGMAAATLVARRSLPVGLAVGAVSAALDKVQEATRAKAAERRVVESEDADDDGVLGQSARAALVSARAAALRLGLGTETAGLADADALLAELAQARARAWRHTGS
ncbi:MAG TPA: GTPase, partial [Longimicrobium sp.]|nr:GTPase [Longimicrobium sp.]